MFPFFLVQYRWTLAEHLSDGALLCGGFLLSISTFVLIARDTKFLVGCTECRVFCESGILCICVCRRMSRTGVSEWTIYSGRIFLFSEDFLPFLKITEIKKCYILCTYLCFLTEGAGYKTFKKTKLGSANSPPLGKHVVTGV